MAKVRSGITSGVAESTERSAQAPGGRGVAARRYARLALLALVLGAGTAGATTTPSVQTTPGTVQTTPSRSDAGTAAVDQRINSECSGLAGAQRHECVFDVLARDRKRSGTAAN